jgi:hypothetical protein
MNDPDPQSIPTQRRWLWPVNFALGILAVLMLAGMANYFSHRHHHLAYWTQRLKYKFSPLTQKVVQSIDTPVRIVVYYNQKESLYHPIMAMLRQYERLNPHLKVEAVDYDTEPGKTRLIKSEFHLSDKAKDLVIFHANRKTDVVPHNKLSKLGSSGRNEEGRPVFKRTHFNGEQMFTSALVTVSDPEKPVVYYLAENGVHSFSDTKNTEGYGQFGSALARWNVDLRPLSLSEKAVPADCRLLIVPGPRKQLDALSLQRLRDHLNKGGRQLILFHQSTRAGLERLMASWGVLVRNDEVNDPDNDNKDKTFNFSKFDLDKQHGVHRVVRTLNQQKMSLRMYEPRSVTDRKSSPEGGENVRRTALISTGPRGLTYLPPLPGMPPNLRHVGIRGHIPVAMAVERDPLRGMENDKTVRLIVMGDSAWLSNGFYHRNDNAELARHLVDWMLDRSHLLAIGPKPIKGYQFSLTETNGRALRGWLLGIVPGSILGLGFLVWLRRKH